MGWAVGSDRGRDIGYGVPAVCDHPHCTKEIDRGLSYVCGSEPYGGQFGCGLFFCGDHLDFRDIDDSKKSSVQLCQRCLEKKTPFDKKPDVAEWVKHKLTDPSWAEWRAENHEAVEKLSRAYGIKAD